MFPNQMYQNRNMNMPYMQNNGITWVQGIEGAKAWQLSPNSNILLMDSENDGKFYIKVSDSIGMCNLRVFEYKEVTNEATPASPDLSQYVKKSELQELINSMIGGNSNEQSLSTAIKSNDKYPAKGSANGKNV